MESQLASLELASEIPSEDEESGIGYDHVDFSLCEAESTTRRRDPRDCLPFEILAQILCCLEAEDVLAIRSTSKGWRIICDMPSVWRTMCLREIHEKDISITRGARRHCSLGMGDEFDHTDVSRWKELWKINQRLRRRWGDGYATAIYLEGHTDSVYCIQADQDKIVTGSRDRTVRIWDTKTYKCRRVLGNSTVANFLPQSPLPDIGSMTPRPYKQIQTPGPDPRAGPQLPLCHTGSVLCLQYDDTMMVTGSSDHRIIVWHADRDVDFVPHGDLIGHTGGVLDVRLDLSHIVSCSKDATIRVWDRINGTCLRCIRGHRGPVNALQTFDNRILSASCDGLAKMWDLTTGSCIQEFSSKRKGLACIEVSANGLQVILGGGDKVIYIFDATTGTLVKEITGHQQLVRSLYAGAGHGHLITGSYDQSIRIFDIHTGQELVKFENWTNSWVLSARADHRRIVAASQSGRAVVIDFGYDLPGIDKLDRLFTKYDMPQ